MTSLHFETVRATLRRVEQRIDSPASLERGVSSRRSPRRNLLHPRFTTALCRSDCSVVVEIAVLVVGILVQLVVRVGKLVVYRVVLAIELLVQTSVFSPRHPGVLGVRPIVFGLEVLVALLVFRVEPPVPRSVRSRLRSRWRRR